MDTEFIEDTYTCTTWQALSQMGDQALNVETNPCFDKNNSLLDNISPYSNKNKEIIKNHVLKNVVSVETKIFVSRLLVDYFKLRLKLFAKTYF